MPQAVGLSTSGLAPRRVGLTRLLALGAALGFLTVLVVAARLDPSPAGAGTHMQLGLPNCGWMMTMGKPCPTCGMTTAFAQAAHGRLDAAVAVQPMGAILSLVSAAGFWIGLYVAATGSRIGEVCGTLAQPRVLWALVGAGAAAWAYKLYTWP